MVENLLQFYELFKELREEPAIEELRLAVCRRWAVPENIAIRNACNEQMVMLTRANAPIPQALLIESGADFLLRQAVVVTCTVIESFFWDSLRENVLTIVRARRRGADESLRGISLTLDDYLSLENYTEPDERLRQIILKNFERRTLYNSESIDRIAEILTVHDLWGRVSEKCGQNPRNIRRNLDELILRRNDIAHRADRPDTDEKPSANVDSLSLRTISYPWVNTRISTAKSVVVAADECIREAIQRLERQLRQAREQKLAQQTLKKDTSES